MYLVQIFDGPNDPAGITIHSPYSDGPKLSEGKITQKLSGIDDFSFSLNPSNPGYRKIKPLTTLIKVTNIKTGAVEFDGRVLQPNYKMADDGAFADEYVCESKLAYLHDSSQRFAEFTDTTVAKLFTAIINRHNATVEEHKRFKVGKVTVTADASFNEYQYVEYDKTYDTIKTKLIDVLGGYLVIREEPDGTYIDYLKSVGTTSKTTISIARNLKSISRDINPTNVITRLIPLGVQLGNDTGNEGASARLTIADANGGKDYIDDKALQAVFGIVEGTVEFDEVDNASDLLAAGRKYLSTQKASVEQYDISAVDLSLIGLDIEGFTVGNSYYIDNPYITGTDALQIIEKGIDIASPQASTLTFGDKQRTLTQYLASLNKQTKTIASLRNTVTRQAQALGTLKTQVETVDSAVQAIELTLQQNDLPALNQAVTNLQSTVDDLNETIDGMPVYGPATPTTDGLMSASDKTKLDAMPALTTADKTKLDLITVTQAVSLDDLVARVTALENAGGNV